MSITFTIFFCLLVLVILIWFFSDRRPYQFVGLSNIEAAWRQQQEQDKADPVPPTEAFSSPDIEEVVSHHVQETKIMQLLDFDTVMADWDQIREQAKQNGTKAPSSGQYICTRTLEAIFQRPFDGIRPDFLRSTRVGGRNLELDGFNQDLMLAFEYQGYQHYEYPNRYHKTYEAFELQLKHDRFKIRVCPRLGITLLIIPYTVPDPEIPVFIANLLPPEFARFRYDL